MPLDRHSGPEVLGDRFVSIGCCRDDCAMPLIDRCAHPEACGRYTRRYVAVDKVVATLDDKSATLPQEERAPWFDAATLIEELMTEPSRRTTDGTALDTFVKAPWGVYPAADDTAPKRPLRCRIGWHKKRLRHGPWASKTFLLIGVNLYECERCDWFMKGMGEP